MIVFNMPAAFLMIGIATIVEFVRRKTSEGRSKKQI